MYRSNSKRNELRLIAISLGYKDVTSRNKETMDLINMKQICYMKKNTKVGTVVVDKVNEKIELYSKNEYNSIFII